MTQSFSVGQQFKHYNGYIWTITEILGNTIKLVSTNQTDGQTVLGSMKVKDLKSLVSANYYSLI